MARLNEFSRPARAPRGRRDDPRNSAVREAYESGLADWAVANGFICADGTPMVYTAKHRRQVERAMARHFAGIRS